MEGPAQHTATITPKNQYSEFINPAVILITRPSYGSTGRSPDRAGAGLLRFRVRNIHFLAGGELRTEGRGDRGDRADEREVLTAVAKPDKLKVGSVVKIYRRTKWLALWDVHGDQV